MSSAIDVLNRRLGERLGLVQGGSLPRFAWKYAPDVPWVVYAGDDRTLIRRTWADMTGADGQPIGKTWLLAGWGRNQSFDHHGFGEGMRVAVQHDYGYTPYFETALATGVAPTEDLTAWIIHKIDHQLANSVEHKEDSYEQYMAEEKYTADRNGRRDANDHLERSRKVYDDNVGAFGNCEVGVGDGFMSWGGLGDSPLVKKLSETSAA